MITLSEGHGIRWRGETRNIDSSADQRGERLRIAARLDKTKIASGLHIEAAHRLDAEIMRIAPDPADADLLAFDVFRFFYIAAGDQRLGHGVFDATDEHHVRRALHVSAHVTDASGERHICIAAQQSCRNDPGRSDEYQLKVNIVFLE